ncbi:MAG: GNAT family N-acetyltransferase [Kineosporiaceae bacterium]
MKFGMNEPPAPDAFGRRMMDQVVRLFVVELSGRDEAIGFAMLQNHSPAGHVEVGIYTDDSRSPVGAGAEATVLLINYAFAALEVLKVYAVTTELSRGGFGVAFTAGVREATLPDHFYFHGRLWDAYYYAVTLDEWLRVGIPFVDRLTSAPSRARSVR